MTKLIYATFYVAEGCDKDEDEYSYTYRALNFDFPLDYPDQLEESLIEWWSERKQSDVEGLLVEVIFKQEFDGGGSTPITAEYWTPVFQQRERPS